MEEAPGALSGPILGPIRRCAACRRRRPKAELLRFVRRTDPAGEAAGGVVFDPGQRHPGRGGYCCPDPACLDRAVRRGGLGRTLRAVLSDAEGTGLVQEAVEYLRQADFTAGQRPGDTT